MKLLLCVLMCCSLMLSVSSAWDDFRVTWPKFSSLPQTQADAVANGWIQDTNKACTAGTVQGNRFYLPTDDNPLSMFLIFNGAGRIAGAQAASQTIPPALVAPNGAWTSDSVKNTQLYTLTMYFRDPSTICSGTNTGAQIGDGLWFSTGNGIEAIPSSEQDVHLGVTTWGKGKCFPTMGNHYWYAVSAQSDCNTLLPIFLLYNGGHLSGFGFSLAWGAAQPGGRWEHPPALSLPLFFAKNQLAQCFYDKGRVFSTMHFYFSNPVLDWC